MEKEQIPPEESAALDGFIRERNIAALLIRVVNGTAPVRNAARKAIDQLLGEKPENAN